METNDLQQGITPGKVIGGLVMVAGVVIAALHWDTGKVFSDSLIALLLYVFFGFWIVLLEDGIVTGKLIARTGYIYREKNPRGFWFIVILYVAVILFFLSTFALIHLGDLGYL